MLCLTRGQIFVCYNPVMIKFLTTGHHYTLEQFLKLWGLDVAPLFDIQDYRSFVTSKKHTLCSTYIFSDLERVSPPNMSHLEEIWQQLSDIEPHSRLLNHPAKVKKRVDLLQTLYQLGINDFTVYPILPDDIPQPKRFPVFIREANDHKGNLSPLLEDQSQLEETIIQLRSANKLGLNPIVTEYISVRNDQGYFHKYGAFRIGDRIIAAHYMMEKQWVVKGSAVDTQDFEIQADYDYVINNPHAQEVMEIFKLAQIDYGRIDYALVNGKIQVFEINTNPALPPPKSYPQYPLLQKRVEYAALQLNNAFKELESSR